MLGQSWDSTGTVLGQSWGRAGAVLRQIWNSTEPFLGQDFFRLYILVFFLFSSVFLSPSSSYGLSTSTVFHAGHSLGGIVLSSYLEEHQDLTAGAILYGSYLPDLGRDREKEQLGINSI